MPFDVEHVRAQLPGRRIEWLPATSSTMTVAAKLAREQCESGTIVGADEQTAGVGRHGRAWHSEADAGLYVSFVLRLACDLRDLPVVSLALALAAKKSIERVSEISVDLRWPNDVLVNGRKCAGILAQFDTGAVIAGIGINTCQAEFPAELSAIATSLRREGVRAVSREALLVALAQNIDEYCEVLTRSGRDAILTAFSLASSYVDGMRLRVDQDIAVLEGTSCGLDESGFLRLRLDNGKVTTILAGGVRPV